MKTLIHNVHDRFFRASFSESKVAKAFMQKYLPAAVLKAVNLDTLQLQKESFVDESLKLAITDMLFFVDLAERPGYIFCLIEHQSKPDKLMPFRLLKYSIAIMEQHMKNTQSDKLPVIIPMLFYTGEAPYNYSTDILDLFDDPHNLAKDTFAKPFKLINLQQISDAVLRQQAWLGITALCMKHVFTRDFMPVLQSMVDLLEQVENEGGSRLVQAALTYLLTTGEVSDSRLFLETVQNRLSPETRESIMTIAQQIEAKGIEKGMQQGIQKGRLEERREIAKELWQQGMPIDTISRTMKISVAELQALLAEKNAQH